MGSFVYALKGIIVYSPEFSKLEYHENEYVVCENGKVAGIFKELPERYQGIYLATKGGGSFWGKVGSFEEDYCFDAVVIDDKSLFDFNEHSLKDRLQRILWLSDERNISAKYINGQNVYNRK